MGWATKLLLAENRTPFIPSSKRTMIWAILDVCAIRFELSILFHCFIDSTLKLGESPFLGDVNLFPNRNKSNLHSLLLSRTKYLLATRELELGSAKGFDNSSLVLVRKVNTHDGLSNIHAGNSTNRGFPKAPLNPAWSLYFKLINNF